MSRIITFLIIMIMGFNVSAQHWSDYVIAANKQTEEGHYDSSIDLLKKALSAIEPNDISGQSSVLLKLANVSQLSGDLIAAKKYYRKLFTTTINEPGYYSLSMTGLFGSIEISLSQRQYDSTEYYLNYADKVNAKNISHQKWAEWQMKIDNSLAILYNRRGQPQRSIELYQRQIKLFKSPTSALDSTHLSDLHLNLSTTYMSLSAYNLAEFHTRESLRLLGGKSGVKYFQTINNLASIYRYTERLDSAKIMLNELVALVENQPNEPIALYATLLNNLAEIYLDEEEYDLALRYYEKAISFLKDHYQSHTFVYQQTLVGLAETYMFSNELDKAEKIYIESKELLLSDIASNFTYLSEEEQRAFYLNLVSIMESFELFAMIRGGAANWPEISHNKQIYGHFFDFRLATKGLLLNNSFRLKKEILASEDDELKKNFQDWQVVRDQLASATSIDEKERLLKKAEVLEKTLARQTHQFDGANTPTRSWKDIRQKLAPGEAAVELIRIFNGFFYVALIVTPDTQSQPELALIKGETDRLLEKEYFNSYHNHIQLKVKDTTSHRIFWKPIKDTLEAYSDNPIKKIYIAADGIYNQINLNTLFDTESQIHLLDQVELVQLSSLNDLFDAQHTDVNKSALLIGRPDFSNTEFADLKATEDEVKNINTILNQNGIESRYFTGSIASESLLKSLDKLPGILHFATHGYFVEGEEEQSLVDYMLQSGIVLSAPEPSKEDGILTAYEMTNLNMANTELVVLSACETGLGKVEAREGVYGLQRAVHIAGARAIIMSLWKVDDQATSELMTHFYTNWLSMGDKRAAFIEAQQQLRKKHPEPYYWGAFVLVGD
ncbi:CHAT domain-containing protein [Fulvivirga sp. RKSG066]|uniref:CHAT domain-containing protein n=1 Tax=Fulvivirga aurantia TaxID=2529383 RepID=UPI0012BB5448|nr:CHAT domain-containing protein [Fulvivirga aurantia]MTI22294.1 CHAT domain-containing protein [Fulvivirga aurantia]